MSSSWWEIEIDCEPVLEDLIFWRLDKFGCRGAASQHHGDRYSIKTYIPQSQMSLLDLGALALQLKQDVRVVEGAEPRVRWTPIEEEDWASSWKQHWHPQAIGDRFLVCPAWIDPAAAGDLGRDRLLLRLDPGVAFGTGAHQTTQLCLESLEMRLPAPQPETLIADIGCGSGILSIGALLLGASKVYGVDVDPLAVKASVENAQLNQLGSDRFVAGVGSLEMLKELAGAGVRFDGFVCNILAEVILQLLPQFESIAKPTTWGVLSGILVPQAQEIASQLEQYGWIAATLWKRQDWCCFNIRRDPDFSS